MKKIIITGMIALGISVSGCSDFLKEESYGSTTAIFGEENGIKALVYQSYTKVNNLYGGGGQWPAFTEHGADLFLRGGNFTDMYAIIMDWMPLTEMSVGCGTTATRLWRISIHFLKPSMIRLLPKKKKKINIRRR